MRQHQKKRALQKRKKMTAKMKNKIAKIEMMQRAQTIVMLAGLKNSKGNRKS